MAISAIDIKTNESSGLILEETIKQPKRLTLVFLICFLATLFGGVVSMLMSVYLPVAVKDLLGNVSETKMDNVSAWINCIFIFGWMFGGIIWGSSAIR